MTTWMIALAGGVLIGLSATLLLWLNGRVAGVSGILNGVLFPKAGDVSWRAMFLLGLVAGLLVGFGTRMGNGCTSGHGVCGLGRLSMRSLAAVLTFMATAIATTFLVRHVWS